MSERLAQTTQLGDSRPAGVVQPTHERAVRALTALEEKRIRDAEKHIAAIPDFPMIDRAWKLLLRGLVAIEKPDFGTAEPLLSQGFSLSFIDGLGTEKTLDPGALRVAARALHHLGWVYRRQDRPNEASRAHLATYHLREHHGSFDELWETASELGLDAYVARAYEDGQRWHRVAINAAQRVSEEPERKQAIVWTNLSTLLTDSGKHDEAVAAARTARDWWREHDVGAESAAQADLKLGGTLLAQGEALHDRGDKLGRPILDEAVNWLATAREELLAFGPDHAADAQLCLEQKDLAERLLASLCLESP